MTPHHRRRLGVFVGIVLLLPLAAPLAASGDPIDDKRAEAARIQDQLDAQGTKVSVAVEQFNRARTQLSEFEANVAKAEADVARSDERMAEIQQRLRAVALSAYMGGGSTAILSHMAKSETGTELVVKRRYLKSVAGDQRAVLGELRSAKEDLGVLRGRLAAQVKDAQEAADAADASRREAAQAEEAQRAILSRVQGDLADLVTAESSRRLATEAAQAPPAVVAAPPPPVFDDVPASRAPATTTPAPVGVRTAEVASVPPPSSKASIAVETAIAQIGKPYVYGGSGPDSFDCSGLTAYAWAAAGVYLSHNAYNQYFETTRVPIDQVEPGDLLFFGRDGVESIHHNAIYVGGGQMVEASQTGVPIRYRGWRAGDLVGAGRPG